MPIDDIPQIKPKTTDTEEPESFKADTPANEQADSVLIPKLEKTSVDEVPSSKLKRMLRIKFKKKHTKILASIGVFFLVLLLLILIPSINVYRKGKIFYTSTQDILAAGEAQDLPAIKTEVVESKEALSNLQKSFKLLSWTKYIPFFGGYTKDAGYALNAAGYGLESAEILIAAIEPYADIIGFTGSEVTDQAADGQETAQDRVEFVIKTIPDIIPKMDELSNKVNAAKEEIDKINPKRYPIKFAGIIVREKVSRVIELVDQGAELVKNGKPLLEAAPYLLGVEEPRTYLILFQNDKELRPTGGFLTAYSIAKVENGKFEPVSSNDIYNLDGRYRPSVEAPDPIVEYLKGPYVLSSKLRLRDMNWSPDFYESMKLFTEEIEKVGIDEIDGIIAVDTQVVVNLLDAIGPIGVSGFGNFSTEILPECNCPQVVYELESFADVEGPVVWSQDEPDKIIFAPPNYENRKKIIGPLMNSILANALGQEKNKLPGLFEAAFKSLMEKHVLFYLFDAKAQVGVESFGIAGRIDSYNGDYLHINDANLGGRKSNLYVQQEVVQDVSIAKDGSVEKEITITYKNPEKYDGWLNSVLPNWVRIYVPKGSELIDFTGVEEKAEPYEEFDKTVFAGFFELRPEGLAKVVVKYKLPIKVKDDYNLFVQKQPGTDAPLYTITVGKQEEELFLRTDKEFKFSI
ncbi:MAG: DUF4012 domain-containing protein [Microgenomates group bacterium]